MNRISEAVLLFLLNATWQVALVALLASAADRMQRGAKARYRHLLWVLTLAICVTLPGSLFFHSAAAPLRNSVTVPQAQKPLVEGDAPKLASVSPPPQSTRRNWSWIWMKMPVLRVNTTLAMAALLVYLLLLLYRIAKLGRAWMRARAVVRSALPIKVPPHLQEALARCQLTLNLNLVRVLSSTEVAVPSAVGILRPMVILPAYLLAEDDLDLLTSAVGHEAAHIARHDYLMNLIYELASLPLWFHPAIMLLLRRIRQTRELSCDEIVAERLLRPSVYAQSLVQLAAAALPSSSSATIAVGIADADILEERIMRILNHSPLTSRRRPLLFAIAAPVLLAPCVAAAAFAMQVAVRQPANSAAILQAAQSSASGQQLSATSAKPASPASGQQPSATSAMPPSPSARNDQPKASDLPENRETVLVLLQQVKGQGPKGATTKILGSRDDGRHTGKGKGLGVGYGAEEIAAGGPAAGVVGGVPGGVAGGVSAGVAGEVPGGTAGGVGGNPPKGPQHAKPDLSGITEGKLIQLIEPVYPEEAKAAGIQGDVVFKAIIAKTGDLENLRTISGDPTLEAAALDAVKQWKYEPYRLNSEPIEVKTTITFKFRLAE